MTVRRSKLLTQRNVAAAFPSHSLFFGILFFSIPSICFFWCHRSKDRPNCTIGPFLISQTGQTGVLAFFASFFFYILALYYLRSDTDIDLFTLIVRLSIPSLHPSPYPHLVSPSTPLFPLHISILQVLRPPFRQSTKTVYSSYEQEDTVVPHTHIYNQLTEQRPSPSPSIEVGRCVFASRPENQN